MNPEEMMKKLASAAGMPQSSSGQNSSVAASSSSDADLKVQDYLRAMDVVKALQDQEKEIHEQLSQDDKIKGIKEKLRATYRQMGTDVDDAVLEKAVRATLFEHQYEFQPPKQDFSYTLARTYVDRGRIGRQYGIPALVLAGIGAGVWGIVAGVQAHRERQNEITVEDAVEKEYRNLQEKNRTLESIAESPLRGQLPKTEQEKMSPVMQRAIKGTVDASVFFKEYCDDGTADDDVTPENYKSVATKLEITRSALRSLDADLAAGQAFIDYQKDLNQTRQSLDATIATVQSIRRKMLSTDGGQTVDIDITTLARTNKAYRLFLEQAQNAYKAGTINIDSRQLHKGQAQLQVLENLLTEERTSQQIQQEADSLIASTRQSNGASEYSKLTQAAYAGALAGIENRQISLAQQQLARLKQVISDERELQRTRQQLDATVADLRSKNPLQRFLRDGREYYDAGLAAVEQRQVDKAKNSLRQLEVLAGNAQEYNRLTGQVEQMYTSIRQTAREDAALTQAEKIYGEAQHSAQNADTTRLQETVKRLNSLADILNQEYSLRIVSRPGEKSGMDRYYTDKKTDRRLAGYYLIVEAIDTNAQAIPQEIENEEDHRIETVTQWGERVPEEVFENVKRDKRADGRVDNNIVGKKERGYLQVRYDSEFQLQGGRITHW